LNAAALSNFLDSLDGIAYAADLAGKIVAYGANNWNGFAAANGASELTQAETVLGRSVLDVVAGEEVRAAYRRFMTALANDQVGTVRFSYRCDGPGIARAMQMSITRLLWSGAPTGYLFQSTVLDQGVRAPLAYFEPRRLLATDGDGAAARLCSFCQRLCAPGGVRGNPANWTYDAPRAGGDHRIVHAVCPRCDERCMALVADRANTPDLSRRQREVLAMLVRGHPNKMICAKLGMSPNTVKTHLRVIFRELQATNRTEAATEALRRWPDCATNIDGGSEPI
jgi:DNA-binding CsgD family transcriptional regulator